MTSGSAGSATGTSQCRERALKLLARRPHFRSELATKLGARGFPPDEVEAVCDRLTELGLLDDAATARHWVAGRRRRGDGPLKIRSGLKRRAVAEEIVDQVAGLDFEEEVAGAREVAERWLARGRFDRDRLGRHLQGKGWREAAILTVLEEIAGRVEAESRR